MKKLIALITIIALVSVAVFATDTDQNVLTQVSNSTDDTKVIIKTSIEPKVSAAWTTDENLTDPGYYEEISAGTAGDLVFAIDGEVDSNITRSVRVYIRSNKSSQTTLLVTANPLTNTAENNSETIKYVAAITPANSVTASFSGSGEVKNSAQTATWKNTAVAAGTAAYRQEYATVSVTVAESDLAKATTGTYEGSLVLTISSL